MRTPTEIFEEPFEIGNIEEEFEVVQKNIRRSRGVPCVYFGTTTIYFNIAAAKLVNFEYVEIRCTPSYIVFKETNRKNKNGFAMKSSRGTSVCAFPSEMRHRKMIKPGWYELFKAGDAFAVMRYDPIELKDTKHG